MYRLLIVDDEKIIVNGLNSLLESVSCYDLELFKAYDVDEAIRWLERTKIDIVLSDIRMPGMSGLELQKQIHARWPRCKVIFLTGYSDFEYAQQAIRQGSIDYLLKTEGETKIIEAIGKAIASIEAELDVDDLVKKARKQINAAVFSLQKELFLGLLQGDDYSLPVLDEQFRSLQISLRADDAVLLVIGKLESYAEETAGLNRTLCLFAIQNIAEDYLSDMAIQHSFSYDKDRLVWFIQPRFKAEQSIVEAWKRLLLYVHGILELIQSKCRTLLQASVSLIAASAETDWLDVHQKYAALNKMSANSLLFGEDYLLVEPAADPAKEEDFTAAVRFSKEYRQYLAQLQNAVDQGNKDEFTATIRQVSRDVFLSPKIPDSYKSEVYISIILLLYASINARNLYGNADDLRDIFPSIAWTDSVASVLQLADFVFSRLDTDRQSQEHELVHKIADYVNNNLSGDLSLTRISEVVFLSPSYLSRLYKKVTGENLTDTILTVRLEKAKKLLSETNWRMHDIAAEIGLASDLSYFYRLFKKHVGLTPKEYRTLQKSI